MVHMLRLTLKQNLTQLKETTIHRNQTTIHTQGRKVRKRQESSVFQNRMNNEQIWVSARPFVIAGCIFHAILSIILGGGSFLPAIFNYFISRWVIRNVIKPNKHPNNPIALGIIIPISMSIIQFVGGYLWYNYFLTLR